MESTIHPRPQQKAILRKNLYTLLNGEQAYHNKLLFWYIFFMAFPVPLLVYNINFYIFPFLILAFRNRFGFIFKYRSILQIFAVFFGIGAILSTYDSVYPNYSLIVLPNYIYWCILVTFLISHANNLNYPVIFKALMGGFVLSIAYYFFLQNGLGLRYLPIFKKLPQNTFAFVGICFAPMIVHYIKKRYGFKWGVIGMLGLTAAAFLCGSRSGSILIFLGTITSLNADRLNFVWGIPIIVSISLFLFILNASGILPQLIKNMNARTYELIYDPNAVFTEDRSYLVRVAMIYKGLALYESDPLTGVGLYNFIRIEQRISGGFTGDKYVLYKNIYTRTSAHNSYIHMLAEGGLFLLVPYILLVSTALLLLLLKYAFLPAYKKSLLFGLMAMSVHLYFVSAIVNVFAWLLIGLACAVATTRNP